MLADEGLRARMHVHTHVDDGACVWICRLSL